jgi:hypothetical protein
MSKEELVSRWIIGRVQGDDTPPNRNGRQGQRGPKSPGRAGHDNLSSVHPAPRSPPSGEIWGWLFRDEEPDSRGGLCDPEIGRLTTVDRPVLCSNPFLWGGLSNSTTQSVRPLSVQPPLNLQSPTSPKPIATEWWRSCGWSKADKLQVENRSSFIPRTRNPSCQGLITYISVRPLATQSNRGWILSTRWCPGTCH